ncbi:amt1, partial [Symbiodinium sp. KB8]
DLTVDAVSELKVGRLREELRAAGLDDSGIRSALVQRRGLWQGRARSKAQRSLLPEARVVEAPTSDVLLVVGDFTGDHPQRTDHQDTTRRPPRDRYDTKKPPRDNETTKRPRRDHWAMNRTPRGDHQEATRSHLDTFQRTPRHHEQTTHVEKNEEADRATSQRPLRDHLSSNWCMKKHGANALFGEHQALRETVFARTMTCFGNARQMFSTKKQRPAKSMHRTIVADTRTPYIYNTVWVTMAAAQANFVPTKLLVLGFCNIPEAMTDAAVKVLANMTQADAPLTATEDAGAVAWVLTSTALVFLMTAGLGFFYGGLVRDTNIINTMMMSVVSMGIVTLTWALERDLKGKSTSVGASVGAVAGLVVITPAAGFVTPGWSIAIGALGAPWCYLTVEAVNRINLVDDTLDAFGLHGSGGFAGAILTGIFAVDEGLIYSGSFVLLGKQIAGALAGVAFSAVGTAIIMGVMKLLFKLRIPEEHEIGGVDEHTHGESYHSPIKKYSAGGRMTESETSKESDAV